MYYETLFLTKSFKSICISKSFTMRKQIQITIPSIGDLLSLGLWVKFLKKMLNYILKSLWKYGLKIGLLLLVMLFLMKDDFNLRFHFNSRDIIPNSAGQLSLGSALGSFLDFDNKKHISTGLVTQNKNVSQSDWGNTYSNMTYHGNKKDHALKKQRQLAYVERFKDVARSEMVKYGIPASITLAQGLIESNAGESRLSRENNNHFGMKCFSKSCKKGHCSNFMDDSHKDFFRKYTNSWESFRAHSLLLSGKRYKNLHKHGKDYEKWAHGLKKAGYATDKRYAEKLIHIIKELELYRYDN